MEQESAKEKLTSIYQKMKNERFNGEISIDGFWIVWKFSENISIKVTIDNLHEEGYISVTYLKQAKSTHWHPELDELYDDLLKINNNNLFGVIKKRGFLFRNHFFMMNKDYWESLNVKKKSKYTVL
ncbi:MAG: hypothetical protein ACI4JM_00460 [Oscillospiraceae bacterium]